MIKRIKIGTDKQFDETFAEWEKGTKLYCEMLGKSLDYLKNLSAQDMKAIIKSKNFTADQKNRFAVIMDYGNAAKELTLQRFRFQHLDDPDVLNASSMEIDPKTREIIVETEPEDLMDSLEQIFGKIK